MTITAAQTLAEKLAALSGHDYAVIQTADGRHYARRARVLGRLPRGERTVVLVKVHAPNQEATR